MTTTVSLLHLSQGQQIGEQTGISYLRTNIVWRYSDHGFEYQRALSKTQAYQRWPCVDDINEFEEALKDRKTAKASSLIRYRNTIQEPDIEHLHKFDAFSFKGRYLCDNSVTKAILEELRFFKENKKFKDSCRTPAALMFLNHIEALAHYHD